MTALTSHFLSPQRSDEMTIHHHQALIAAEPLLIQVLDAMPNGVVILDPNRQIIHYNSAFGTTIWEQDQPLGLRPGEVLNCAHAWENPARLRDSGPLRYLRCGQSYPGGAAGHGDDGGLPDVDRQRCGNQRPRSTHLGHAVTLEDAQFTIFAVNDISGEKRRKALERIFFHDIRNSAGAISGVAQLLEMSAAGDLDEIHSYGELLTMASAQLLDEIHSQRQLLAAENGELAINLDDIDSLSFLEHLVLRYRNHDVAAGRTVAVAATCELHRVCTDPALLNRVLGNMVKNALEASGRGATVTVSCEEIDDGVRFWVHNPGFIPRNVQLQLFHRSYSTKGEGRGLGTFSMKLLTEKYLGGKINFISTRAGGTTFMVSLPR